MKTRHKLKVRGIIAVTVLTLGLTGMQIAMADGQDTDGKSVINTPCSCNGQGFTEEQQKKHADLLDETVELRKNMAVKRAEMNALMKGSNPDTAKVSALSAQLFELREVMRKKAQEKGLMKCMGHGGPGMMGRHHGMKARGLGEKM